MKKFLLVALIGLLSIASSAPANGQTSQVTSVTLASFGSSTKLSSAQTSQLKKMSKDNPAVDEIYCVGNRLQKATQAEVGKIRARAKAACDFAAKASPKAQAMAEVKVAADNKLAGRVVVTFITSSELVGSIEIASYDPARVALIAHARVNEYLIARSSAPAIGYELKAGPKVTSAQVTKEKERISKSAVFWSEIYAGKPTLFLYSGADANWMVSELNILGNYFHDSYIRNQYWQKTGICTLSLAVVDEAREYYINCQRPGFLNLRSSTIAAHEFAHIPLTTKFNNQPGGKQTPMPTWLNEGGAEFFGLVLTDQATKAGFGYWNTQHMGTSGSVKLSTRDRSQTLKQTLINISDLEAEELFLQMEGVSALENEIPYSVGRWATELLIAHGGVEKYFAFLNALNPATDWKAAFQATYGLSITDFYKLTAPYLSWLASNF